MIGIVVRCRVVGDLCSRVGGVVVGYRVGLFVREEDGYRDIYLFLLGCFKLIR